MPIVLLLIAELSMFYQNIDNTTNNKNIIQNHESFNQLILMAIYIM